MNDSSADHLSPEDAARLAEIRGLAEKRALPVQRSGYGPTRYGWLPEHIDFLLRLLDETRERALTEAPETAVLLAEIARLKAAPSHRNYVEIARLRALVIERAVAVLAEALK